MQGLSFVPHTNSGSREPPKNYVFVDEHNRHKRLKVLRACEGCRRRKIKCDAATTNTWPCSACIRLKLNCVPPTPSHDSHDAPGPVEREPEPEPAYDPFHKPQSLGYSSSPTDQSLLYPSFNDAAVSQPFPAPQTQTPLTPEFYQQDPHVEQDLAKLLGDLKMDDTGTAPYLRRKKSQAPMDDVFEEPETAAMSMPINSGADLKVRIPPELMPDEETALQYFEIYFSNAHPYVPVVDKASFYRKWRTNRDSISPLLLEAIFAEAGKLADEPSQGQQWLALASRHADAFMDIPRLSTLQAMLIILKAREASPKRGYYYRSWMSIVNCIAMAQDLGLGDHYQEHQAGVSCGDGPRDCYTKTRIWQVLFAVEVMIGASQGRLALSIDPESVNLNTPPASLEGDSEYQVSRQFTYLVRVIFQVRKAIVAYARYLKANKGGLPEYSEMDSFLEGWLASLPADLQVSYPPDGSPPWIQTHFLGNLHSYYQLAIVSLHRLVLGRLHPSQAEWKTHMLICYNHAKLLCRLHESVLQSFGVTGLMCMQRGINFTVYCTLTCAVIHLVAITSPDPALNTDAREYFTRHMRLLEECTSAFPFPDMQQQIDALREAFSADTRRPFELKPSFPYATPVSSTHNSPQDAYTHDPKQYYYTPPPIDLKQLNYVPPVTQPHAFAPNITLDDNYTWNPSRIFDQWNTSFNPRRPNPVPEPSPAQFGTQPYDYVAPMPSFVSPSMWQESVANTFEGV